MACGILFSLFLNLEWGFYVLLSVISCGSMLFMLYIFYSYIIESYETLKRVFSWEDSLIYLFRNKLLCPVVAAFYIANTDVSEAVI